MHNPVGIPGAVLFHQRRGHCHRGQAYSYLVRFTNSLGPGVITLAFVLVIHVARYPEMFFVRMRKGLHVIPGFPAVVGVHEGVRPVQAFEVDDVISR